MPNTMLIPPDMAGVPNRLASGAMTHHLEWTEQLRDGTSIVIRAIRNDDELLEKEFIEGLSVESRRYRFRGTMNHPSAALVAELTHLAVCDAAFVAFKASDTLGPLIGVARFSARNDLLDCECAVAVADEWQKMGLATLLMRHLIDVARTRGTQCMYANSSVSNLALHDLAKNLGFKSQPNPNDRSEVIHTLDLHGE